MSAAKPIDWFKPLRSAVTRRAVRVVGIHPHSRWPVDIEFDGIDDRYRLYADRDGRDQKGTIIVENIPTEPEIVERFTVVHLDRNGEYSVPPGSLVTRDKASAKAEACFFCRIARLLIEEPGK